MAETTEVPIRAQDRGKNLKKKILRSAGALAVAAVSTYGALSEAKPVFADPDRTKDTVTSTAPITPTVTIDKEAQKKAAADKISADRKAAAAEKKARAAIAAAAAGQNKGPESTQQTPNKTSQQGTRGLNGNQETDIPWVQGAQLVGGLWALGATGASLYRNRERIGRRLNRSNSTPETSPTPRKKGILEKLKGLFKRGRSEPNPTTPEETENPASRPVPPPVDTVPVPPPVESTAPSVSSSTTPETPRSAIVSPAPEAPKV